MTATQLKTLVALVNALNEATGNGLLDHLAIYIHPDTINAFCLAVADAVDQECR
jgi:hypothetical protein